MRYLSEFIYCIKNLHFKQLIGPLLSISQNTNHCFSIGTIFQLFPPIYISDYRSEWAHGDRNLQSSNITQLVSYKICLSSNILPKIKNSNIYIHMYRMCKKPPILNGPLFRPLPRSLINVKCERIEDSMNLMISLKDVRSVLLVRAQRSLT